MSKRSFIPTVVCALPLVATALCSGWLTASASCPDTIPFEQACPGVTITTCAGGDLAHCSTRNDIAVQDNYFGCQVFEYSDMQCLDGTSNDTAVCYYQYGCKILQDQMGKDYCGRNTAVWQAFSRVLKEMYVC